MTFSNKVIVVTGGSSGIGAETVTRFHDAGATLVVLDCQPLGGEHSDLDAARLSHLTCDVASQSETRVAFETIIGTHGGVDVLINNAGITRDRSALKMNESEWEDVVRVSLTGTFNCCQAAARSMKARGWGRIINTASTSALGKFGQANYAAAKSGIIGLTRTLAIEWAGYGVTVNAVAPGLIATPMTEAMPETAFEVSKKSTPVGRVGTPEDIANAHLFLASEESSFITGQVLFVDGGKSLGQSSWF